MSRSTVMQALGWVRERLARDPDFYVSALCDAVEALQGQLDGLRLGDDGTGAAEETPTTCAPGHWTQEPATEHGKYLMGYQAQEGDPVFPPGSPSIARVEESRVYWPDSGLDVMAFKQGYHRWSVPLHKMLPPVPPLEERAKRAMLEELRAAQEEDHDEK